MRPIWEPPWVKGLAVGLLTTLLAACGNGVAPNAASSGQEAPIRDLSDLKIPTQEADSPAPLQGERIYDVDKLSANATFADYYGYDGPWYSQLQWDTGFTILGKSVYVDPASETWSANALVRNDTLTRAGVVVVRATLKDAAGKTLGMAEGVSPVLDARPGEPVPIHLESDVRASDVVEVSYATGAEPPNDEYRQIEIMELRAWPYGDRPAIDEKFLSEDQGQGPLPYVSLLFATNEGEQFVSDYDVTIGWISQSGELVHFRTASPSASEQTADQRNVGREYMIVESDRALATKLQDLQQVRWVTGEIG